MSTKAFKYQFPSLFRRLPSQTNNVAKHLIALREKKQYRTEQQHVIVQGLKTIRELCKEGLQMHSIIVTAKSDPYEESEVKYPAIDVIRHPEEFKASKYYLTDVHLARRILGTASRPGNHEIYAEVVIPQMKCDFSDDHVLILDQINDPGNLGSIIRTARALNWNTGVVTSQSCDVYNDKTIRASRALSLTWKHEMMEKEELKRFMEENDITPVVADMIPDSACDLWSPEFGTAENKADIRAGSGLWFWNFRDRPQVLPKRVGLVLSSEHQGVRGFSKELRVSVPMNPKVESLNVANVGGIIMSELNRLSLST
ncbi:Alpha/beta knot methyltransferase [Pilobolus umbonatus]|nr:Alpha/beta knot methyltransferase [Pilobolus umbonatus]